MNAHRKLWRRKASAAAVSLALLTGYGAAWAEGLTVLHIGDQESWLISAQGNLRDTNAQALSFYGGVDRLATVIGNAKAAAAAAGKSVITLNAGDSFLPGPRLTASFANLGTAAADGGQDFYDAMATRQIGFDATTFGNHEFDLDNTGPVAARFAKMSGSTYLSVNLDFSVTPELADLAATGVVAPSKIITTAGGKKVGIIGATTPLLPGISSPPAGIMKNWTGSATEVQNIQAIASMVQAEVDRLRNVEGVTAVIVMSHLQSAGNEIGNLVPALRDVDLVISGGGHELMSDPDDVLIGTGISGIAPTYNTHPVQATDSTGKRVPVVTGHFGNRYVGEVNLTLDDTTGQVTSLDSTRMIRVSGASSDADRVTGNAAINAAVVTPVLSYINVLNSQVIGTTATRLNGPTHTSCTPVAPATRCTFVGGLRNAETGLGNLVADAMRFAGKTEVAIQNGGGVRVTIPSAGNVTTGDTFNILPFTNLVKRAPTMTAAQLKDIQEHSVYQASPNGAFNGRFAQVSGMQVFYDTTRTARASTSAAQDPTAVGTGQRVRRIVLDDGTVLVDNGMVVNNVRAFSFTTIDFTAAGGDNYPFAANGVAFENDAFTITYQEALANYIKAAKADGGLQRLSAADGDEITTNLYGIENPFDAYGRLVDLDITAAVKEHHEKQAIASIVGLEVPREEVHNYGVIVSDGQGRIEAFQEKPKAAEARSTLVSTGVYILEPQVLDRVPPGKTYDFGAELFPQLAAEQAPFYVQNRPFNWIDIGRVSDYWTVLQRVLRGEIATMRMPGREVRPGVWVGINTNVPWDKVNITGPVYIGSSVQIEPGATIVGPVWIGHGCVIRGGAHVDRSVLFDYTRIAPYMSFSEMIVSRQYCVNRHGDTLYAGDDSHPLRWGDARA